MIKNDEDYLISRTYTNYGGSKMSADEMFKELGYRKNFEDKYRANYEDLGGTIINFDKDIKQIRIWNSGITIQELQAINKKVEELGWNE